MENRNGEVHIDETEVSGGSKEGVVRWVLVIGTLLAVVFLSIIWITGAATQGDVEEEATVSGQTQADTVDGVNTDSILVEDADEFGTPETGDTDTGALDTIPNDVETDTAS